MLFKTTIFPEMVELDSYINIREAAKQIGIHEESLRRIIRIGTLPAEKIGGQWFIPREQFALFLATYDAKTGKRKQMI
jgi:excisionase family DNA binding protein